MGIELNLAKTVIGSRSTRRQRKNGVSFRSVATALDEPQPEVGSDPAAI